MTDFKVTIPKPCHRDWNKMTPEGEGKFCGACGKIVVDFTSMNMEEIKLYFALHHQQKICGHFKVSQTAPLLPRHHQLLIRLYEKAGTKFSTHFLRTPLLWGIGMLLVLAGCKSNTTERHAAASKDSIASRTDTLMGKPTPPPLDSIRCNSFETITGEAPMIETSDTLKK